MTLIKCTTSQCEYCVKGICSRDEVTFDAGDCEEYLFHPDVCPDYRNTFWKRIKSRKDNIEKRLESNQGKRYEVNGLVFFTEDDDRNGIDEIWFTEERTGRRLLGKYLKPEFTERIRSMDTDSPLMELPVADYWEDM